MANWTDVCATTDVPDGSHQCYEINNVRVVVCQVDGEFHAVANICPHAHLPLGEGELHGRILVCPFHGYSYNVTTGRNADFPDEELPVDTYPVLVDGQRVMVDLPEEQ